MALGVDYVDDDAAANVASSSSAAAADTYAATSMRASIIQGRRLAAIQRAGDQERRLAARLISSFYAHEQTYGGHNATTQYYGPNAELNAALDASSAAAATDTYNSTGLPEPESEPEPGP